MSGIRKQHLLVAFAFVWLVVASCLLEQVDARKHRGSSKRSDKRPKGVNIEIYHPKGVIIWYPYRPGIEMFGIEIFINQANDQASSEEAEPSCEICLNTTEVSYGKFILRNDDAIIRSRDHLIYNAIVKKTSGEAYISRTNEFYVSENRILLGDIGANRNSCATAITDVSSDDQQKIKEINLLEAMLQDAFQQCQHIQNGTKQLILIAETPTRYDAKKLYQYTIGVLEEKIPSIDWKRTLVEAFYSGNNIGIEVSSVIDKLKILHLAKSLPDHAIIDMDTIQSDDILNDINSWV